MGEKKYCYICGDEIKEKTTYQKDGPHNLLEPHCESCC